MISVAIAHSNPQSRNWLAGAIEENGELEIVVQVSTYRDLMRATREAAWDVLILDAGLCDKFPMLIGRLSRSHPTRRIIISTISCDDARVVQALRAGASGHIHEASPGAQIRDTIERVAAGGRCIRDSVSRQIAVDLLAMVRSHVW